MQKGTIVPPPLHQEEMDQTVLILFKSTRKRDDFALEIVQKEEIDELSNMFGKREPPK